MFAVMEKLTKPTANGHRRVLMPPMDDDLPTRAVIITPTTSDIKELLGMQRVSRDSSVVHDFGNEDKKCHGCENATCHTRGAPVLDWYALQDGTCPFEVAAGPCSWL